MCFPLCVIVKTSELGVIQRLGQYNRLLTPGLSCIPWPLESVAGVVSLRVMEDNFQCETKTKDNVFVTIAVSVQYQVIYDAVYAAFYTLEYPQAQIEAYVMDSIRTSLCTLTLDESFINKDKISHNMKLHLEDVMSRYGFRILNALITDMSPDQRVRAAMNEINSSKRMREAAAQTAEGNKTIVVKKAEATAEGMYLQGVGTARQRKAIMDGLRESIVEFSSDVRDTSPKDVMDLLVLSQYFDTLRELGNAAETRTVYLSAEAEGGATMRSSLLQANAASL